MKGVIIVPGECILVQAVAGLVLGAAIAAYIFLAARRRRP